MKTQITDNDLIEGFLDGSLSNEQNAFFEERVKSDKAFAEALAQRQLLQKAYVEATKRIELKNHIRSIISDEKRKTANQRTFWLIAASITILVGIGSFLLFKPKQTLNNNVAKQDSLPPEDQLVSPNKTNIVEFGTLDTLHQQNEDIKTLLPAEGAVFSQTDTILFSRQNVDVNEMLTITDKTGSVIFKTTIQSGTAEYIVLPFALKPGTYFWNFEHANISHTIIIK